MEIESQHKYYPQESVLAYEKIVLGTMIVFPRCIPQVASIITGMYFQRNTGHNVIYKSILSLEKQGIDINFYSVIAETVNDRSLSSSAWRDVILDLNNYVFYDSNIDKICKKVTDAYYLTLGDKEFEEKRRKYANGEYDSYDDYMKDIAISHAKLEQYKSKKDIVKSSDLVSFTTQRVLEKANKERQPGVKTGIHLFDWLTGGLQETYLVVIAARPGVGKTSLALNMATYMFMGTNCNNMNKNPRTIGFFSYEMGSDLLVEKIIASASGIPLHHIRTGDMTPVEVMRFQQVAEVVAKKRFYIDDNTTQNINDIRSKAIMWKMQCDQEYESTGDEQYKLGAIFVDYLQLIPDVSKGHSRTLEVGAISKGLKNLACELKIPIIALSQLSRDVEKRNAGTAKKKVKWAIPKLSDLRDSGAIEQDSDIVLFVARRGDLEEDNSIKCQEAKLIVAKNRHGACGNIPMVFYKPTASFLNDNDAEFEG